MQRKSSDVKTAACNWCFWQDQWNTTSGDKVQSLSLLGECETAKDFFVLFNRFNVSSIPQGCSLHIFREHVKPEWEDKTNAGGGHYRVFTMPGLEAAESSRKLSCLWFDVVRNIVGEHVAHAEKVVGISYTKKRQRQIVAIWLSDAAEEAARSILSELLPPTASQPFTVKFYKHSELPHNDYTVHESRCHRRTKSAPMVSIEDDEEDDDDVRLLPPPQAELQMQQATLLARRAFGNQARETHVRSHSDTRTMEGFMMQPLAPPRSPSGGCIAKSVEPFVAPDSTLSSASTCSSGHFAPTMFAPTPIKDWTQGWSPSQFIAAQQTRVFPEPPAPISAPTTTITTTTVPGVAVVRTAGTPPPPIAESEHVVVSPQPPRALTPAKLLSSPPPAPGKSPLGNSPGGRSTASTATPKTEALTPPQQGPPQSDRKPFICRGKAYPQGMNRKDYRAIVFNHDDAPKVASYEVDDNAADGDIEQAQFDEYRRRAELKR